MPVCNPHKLQLTGASASPHWACGVMKTGAGAGSLEHVWISHGHQVSSYYNLCVILVATLIHPVVSNCFIYIISCSVDNFPHTAWFRGGMVAFCFIY